MRQRERWANLAWCFPVAGLLLLALFRGETPAVRLAASSVFLLGMMKGAAALRTPGPRLAWRDAGLYALLWPGMDAENFVPGGQPVAGAGHRFGHGLTLLIVGLAVLLGLALAYPLLPLPLVGWLGIAAFLLTIHFGLSEVLTSLFRLSGRSVRPLFDRPLSSRTLNEFWTRRWNLAFVEMDRRLFLPSLVKKLGLRRSVFAVFILSGLLHEMAISYPAGAGWGGPMAYFILQCVGLSGERRWHIRSALWTFAWILVPMPLLFHASFRHELIIPFFAWLHDKLEMRPIAWYVEILLWSLGAMQLSVLLASYQVPKRLNWREELPRLSPFNHKLMWTYAIFIVTTVVSFAILTLLLHNSFLAGEPSAVGLAAFMSGFWILRLVFDAFYYRSEDWPEGEDLKVGHALLNSLFVYLVLGYGSVACYGWLHASGRI